MRQSWAGRSPVQWHTDQSPEKQPPGTTFIAMLESPSTAGGDTLVSSSVRAYSSLSPRFRKRLEGLTAIHSNNDGVTAELKHGEKAVMRRGVLEAEHPVVLVHPVTKQKALCMWLSISIYFFYSLYGFTNICMKTRCQPRIHKTHSRIRPGRVRLHSSLFIRSYCETPGLLLSHSVRGGNSSRLGSACYQSFADA